MVRYYPSNRQPCKLGPGAITSFLTSGSLISRSLFYLWSLLSLHIVGSRPFDGSSERLNKTWLGHGQQIMADHHSHDSALPEWNGPDHGFVLSRPAASARDARIVIGSSNDMSIRFQVYPVIEFIVGSKGWGQTLGDRIFLICPLHGINMPAGVSDVLDFPVHANHVGESRPWLTFHTSFGFLRISAGLSEERPIGDAVNTDHTLARLDEVFNGLLSDVSQPGSVIVVDEHIVIGQSGGRDASEVLLPPNNEAARIF